MTEHTILIETLLSVIWPVIVTVGGLSGVWVLFRSKVSEIRNFVITLDDALADDKLTPEEIREIYKKFTEILKNTK